jgi:hypothetical protein
LRDVPLEDIARAESSLLAEAISRLRAGNVIRDAGYDGEYGVIRLFEESELKRLTAGADMFDAPLATRKKQERKATRPVPDRAAKSKEEASPAQASQEPKQTETSILADLDDDQRAAVETVEGALLILAGPGSG